MKLHCDKLMRIVAQSITVLLAPYPLWGQAGPVMHYPISPALVAQALSLSGVRVDASEVHLPVIVSATTMRPHLQIGATEMLVEGDVRFKVRCANGGECLPFYVTVDVGSQAKALLAMGMQRSFVTSSEPQGVQAPSIGSSDRLATMRSASDGVTRLRAGAQVILFISDRQMSIHLPVIAMDAGSAGSKVRVRTLDRTTILHATVIDAQSVRGEVE